MAESPGKCHIKLVVCVCVCVCVCVLCVYCVCVCTVCLSVSVSVSYCERACVYVHLIYCCCCFSLPHQKQVLQLALSHEELKYEFEDRNMRCYLSINIISVMCENSQIFY